MKLFHAFFLLTCTAFSQSVQKIESFGPQIPRLRQFLNLTDAQYQQLSESLIQFQRFAIESIDRMDQLFQEIVDETARPMPRAAELGTRYVDIELTCRKAAEEFTAMRARNLALLTTAQKGRLQLLLDAIKLFPEIGEAQDVALIDIEPFYLGGGVEPRIPNGGGSCSIGPNSGSVPGNQPGTTMPRLSQRNRGQAPGGRTFFFPFVK